MKRISMLVAVLAVTSAASSVQASGKLTVMSSA